MSQRGRKRRGGHGGDHENEERWLLTYADMITLLMALFMVLFSISSVNKSKYVTLQQSLKEAFSGKILPGGPALLESGGNPETTRSSSNSPLMVVQPPVSPTHGDKAVSPGAREREDRQFADLKRRIDAYARERGMERTLQTRIARRGLVVRMLTDRVVFDSGRAQIKPAGLSLLDGLVGFLRTDRHPILVEGHTDDVPLRLGAQYPSNWELSTARASAVVRFFVSDGIAPPRLGAAGYADLHPVAPNGTAAGRARNRRVEIVLQRLNPAGESSDWVPAGGDALPGSTP
jgi:chemotaxis protein MotB